MKPPRAWHVFLAAAAAILAVATLPGFDAAWAAPQRRLRAVTIDEYYRQSQPDEQYLFMPEARKGPYYLPVKGTRYVFVQWNKLYFGSGRSTRALHSVLSGDPTFNFLQFHELCTWRKNDFHKVEVYGEGHLQITPPTRAYTIVVPIPKAMAEQLKQKF